MNDKRKRAAPTIDLKATEVPSAADENKSLPGPEAPHAELPADESKDDTPPPSPPPEVAPEEASPPPQERGGRFWPAIAGGFIGALIACVLTAALWYAGLLPARTSDSSSDQSAQLAALQKQIRDLQVRPPASSDTQTVDALRQRLGKLENDIAQLPPGDKTVSEQLAAVDNAMKSLGIALAALNKRSDDVAAKATQAQEAAAGNEKALSEFRERMQSARQTASTVDSGAVDALQKRLAMLEQSVTAAQAQIANTAAEERAVRFALAAAALRDAVASGAPYRSERDQMKSLGADEKTLAPLARFADSGLPTAAALSRELDEQLPGLMKAAGAEAAHEGFFGRLQANAGRLVRIQPVGAPPGDDPADVLARLETHAAHADIDAALADIAKLPEAAQREAAGWVSKAQARRGALAAARRLAADAAGRLGQTAGATPAANP